MFEDRGPAAESDEERGLYRKYKVERVDGSTEPGGKHEDCFFFVLDLEHDEYAAPVLLYYAALCSDKYPQLAHDLRALIAERDVEAFLRFDADEARDLSRRHLEPDEDEAPQSWPTSQAADVVLNELKADVQQYRRYKAVESWMKTLSGEEREVVAGKMAQRAREAIEFWSEKITDLVNENAERER